MIANVSLPLVTFLCNYPKVLLELEPSPRKVDVPSPNRAAPMRMYFWARIKLNFLPVSTNGDTCCPACAYTKGSSSENSSTSMRLTFDSTSSPQNLSYIAGFSRTACVRPVVGAAAHLRAIRFPAVASYRQRRPTATALTHAAINPMFRSQITRVPASSSANPFSPGLHASPAVSGMFRDCGSLVASVSQVTRSVFIPVAHRPKDQSFLRGASHRY